MNVKYCSFLYALAFLFSNAMSVRAMPVLAEIFAIMAKTIGYMFGMVFVIPFLGPMLFMFYTFMSIMLHFLIYIAP